MRRIRVGIDVGGTFTHAVAIDNDTLEIVDYAVSPTTHRAAEGVAAGVVKVFSAIRERLAGDEIVFVAHSTTQATNALLEGDVSPVGIIATGTGVEGMKARADADVPPIEVAGGKMLRTEFRFVRGDGDFRGGVDSALSELKGEGCACIVAAEAFSVDDPSNEIFVKERAAEAGLPSCGTFEMSGLYGLRARTRTAVINASILPRMTETADMTERGLAAAGEASRLMVMRSDGGVMSLSEMRKRPLLTLLSGPAAGIAAALAYVRATDAVFLETGGTSTDITAIRGGRAASRSAVIGGHSTYMRTLDCRTVGVAGGSMAAVEGGRIAAVGPRSAHIAGLEYVSFTPPERLGGTLRPVLVRPFESDPGYLAVENEEGARFALTLTCAALMKGYVHEGDYAYGFPESAARGFEAASVMLGRPAQEIAGEMLEIASVPVVKVVRELVSDYGFEGRKVVLIGGGGGSAAVLPFVSEKMGLDGRISSHSEVISAIGAAMAMIRETVEKNVFNPSPADVERIKGEAVEAVVRMGAVPESVDVFVEIDSAKNVVRASASGSMEFRSRDLASDLSDGEVDSMVASYFKVPPERVSLLGENAFFRAYEITMVEKRFFGLFSSKRSVVAAVDRKGVVRCQAPSGEFRESAASAASGTVDEILDSRREYGDAGAVSKGFIMIAGHRIFDYSSLGSEEQMRNMAARDLAGCGGEEKILFIAL